MVKCNCSLRFTVIICLLLYSNCLSVTLQQLFVGYFTVTFVGYFTVAGGRSRLHLIDLGSASKSKDPNNVALSLSALGNVIMALLNGQRHVPHR